MCCSFGGGWCCSEVFVTNPPPYCWPGLGNEPVGVTDGFHVEPPRWIVNSNELPARRHYRIAKMSIDYSCWKKGVRRRHGLDVTYRIEQSYPGRLCAVSWRHQHCSQLRRHRLAADQLDQLYRRSSPVWQNEYIIRWETHIKPQANIEIEMYAYTKTAQSNATAASFFYQLKNNIRVRIFQMTDLLAVTGIGCNAHNRQSDNQTHRHTPRTPEIQLWTQPKRCLLKISCSICALHVSPS